MKELRQKEKSMSREKEEEIEVGDEVSLVAEKGTGTVEVILDGIASVDFGEGREAYLRVTQLHLVTKGKKKGGKEKKKNRAK